MIDEILVDGYRGVSIMKIDEEEMFRVLRDDFPFATLLDILTQRWNNTDEYFESSYFWYKRKQSPDMEVRSFDQDVDFRKLCDDQHTYYTIRLRTFVRSPPLRPFHESTDVENTSQLYYDLIAAQRDIAENSRGSRPERHYAAQVVAHHRTSQQPWSHSSDWRPR